MNPLLALHKQANAETQPYGDVEIVSTFGQMPAETLPISIQASFLSPARS